MFKNDDEAEEHNYYHEWGSEAEGCELCAAERKIDEMIEKDDLRWKEHIWGEDEL